MITFNSSPTCQTDAGHLFLYSLILQNHKTKRFMLFLKVVFSLEFPCIFNLGRPSTLFSFSKSLSGPGLSISNSGIYPSNFLSHVVLSSTVSFLKALFLLLWALFSYLASKYIHFPMKTNMYKLETSFKM